jgi:hypothetical protein
MSKLELRVAEIPTSKKDNKITACVSIFLIKAFLDGKLSDNAEEKLIKNFNDHYETSLNAYELQLVFDPEGGKESFRIPADQVIVLGNVLKDIIKKTGKEFESSNEMFGPLADTFDFDVEFYVNDSEKKIIKESGTIPPIKAKNNSTSLTLKAYHNDNQYNHYKPYKRYNVYDSKDTYFRYDLIMDDPDDAENYNNLLESEGSPYYWEEGENLKEKVKEIIEKKVNPQPVKYS